MVGEQLERRVSFPISESDIRRWAIAVYYPEEPPRQFWDTGSASTTQHGGVVAPEDFNPFAWMVAEYDTVATVQVEKSNPDSTELSLGIKGPGLRFMLNGGLEVDYEEPMKPGDIVTGVTRLAEYRERTGRLGLMLFTVSEDTWTNQNDEVIKRSRSTLIRY